mgnify:FL=1
MLSSIRKAVHGLSSLKLRHVCPGQQQEILQAIRWIHREHVSHLQRLGYSAREAFWLNLACLPFLPWDRGACTEMPLSRVLGVYADLYRSTVEPLASDDEQAFLKLLRQRYMSIRQVIARSDGCGGADGNGSAGGNSSGAVKWDQAGAIVSQTAEEWQKHEGAFPCRLVEDA